MSGAELARGHVLAPGHAEGPVFATEPFSFWGGYSATDGTITDVHHPDRGRSAAHTVLAMRFGRGSSSASAVFAEALRLGTGPVAVVLASPDVILAAGAVVAAELYAIRCPVVVLDAGAFAAVAGYEGRVAVAAEDGAARISAL
jgi:hypothetical protein